MKRALLPASVLASVLAIAAAPASAQSILHELISKSPNYAGHWIAGSIDFSGDGVPDCLVAGSSNVPGCMATYSGKSGIPLKTFATPPGAEPFFTSLYVAIVGDVNHDGVPDVMIGIPMQEGDYQGFTPGTAGLYSGADGATLKTWSDLIQSGLGSSVSRLGDANADGIDDFIISSGSYSNPNNATVYSGSSWNALGTVSGGYSFATALAAAGDVDHDGFGDFVAGVPIPGGSFSNPSTVLVVSGRTGVTILTLLGLPADMSGVAVDGGADVDADGTPDVLAGAPANFFPLSPPNGHVRLYSGATGNVVYDEVSAGATQLGSSVAFVGDVDQDGFIDFAGGEPYDSTSFPNAGAVRVYSGRNGGILASLFGDAPQANFGLSVAAAGDLNQDGRPDILVGASSITPPTYHGRVFAFSLAPGTQQYGTGTPGCSGVHHINTNSVPTIGNTNFAITTDNAPTHALGLGLIANVADFAGSDPFGLGLTLQLDFFASTELLSFDAFSDVEGFAAAPISIPNNPALQGLVRYAETLWYWAPLCYPTPIGLSSSPGMILTVQ